MVFIKYNSLKSDIQFNPIFITGFFRSKFLGQFQGQGFSGYRFFMIQVFPGRRFSGSNFFWVKDLGPGFRSSPKYHHYQFILTQVTRVQLQFTKKKVRKIFSNIFYKSFSDQEKSQSSTWRELEVIRFSLNSSK